jgi:hypothetical protein
MKRLMSFGKGFAFVNDGGMDSAALEILPELPQKARLVKSERMANFRPLALSGNGYRPGPFLELADDQCRYTLAGKTMCGARVERGAWCGPHGAIVRRPG